MSIAVFFPGLMPSKYKVVEEFVNSSRYAQARFGEASEYLGYSLADAYRTANVYDWEVFEASFLALNLALADHVVQDYEANLTVCCGQSFGAVTAAVFSGSLSYGDALRLTRRSILVEVDYFESLVEPVGCHFFYRIPAPVIERLLREMRDAGFWIELSVVLSESVCAVSAPLSVLEKFEVRVRDEGGVPFYTMNRAEHCEAVRPLRDRLEVEVYGDLNWANPKVSMISDVTGTLLDDGSEVMFDLLEGWITPVNWEVVAAGLTRAGAKEVYVLGPRNIFGRMFAAKFPTRLVTPQDVASGRRPRMVIKR